MKKRFKTWAAGGAGNSLELMRPGKSPGQKAAPSGATAILTTYRTGHQLRFTKTGDPKIEEAYARHFIWPGKGPFHPPLLKKPLE